MRSSMKFSIVLVISMIALIFFNGCGSNGAVPEDDLKLESKTKKTSTESTDSKVTPGLGQTMMSYQGKKRELYGYIEYPGFWRLSVVPGIEKTPGIKKPTEIHCDYRLRSLKAMVLITVTDKSSSSSAVLKDAKQKILDLFPESFFKKSPALMVGIGSASLKEGKGSGNVDEIDQLNVPKFDGELPPISGYSKYKVTSEDEKKEYVSGSDSGGALPSELFIRSEKWEQGKEIWSEVSDSSVKFAGKTPKSFIGEFIYDQELYFVQVKVATEVGNNTITGLFICPKDDLRVYYRSFDWISRKFAINKSK